MVAVKPFEISKSSVMEAYKKVKANNGAAGVDKQGIEDFEKDLKGNLYKIWNRMSSGSYFPPPVKAVPIPKKTGGYRILGVPTVGDRVAQMVVKTRLEQLIEPIFHNDSYGYRSGKSAHQALTVTRQRCWRYDWLLEFDICGLFDNIPHDLLLKALRKHTECKWTLLYIERWLTAPLSKTDGRQLQRDKGTPQGGVISCEMTSYSDQEKLHFSDEKSQARLDKSCLGKGKRPLWEIKKKATDVEVWGELVENCGYQKFMGDSLTPSPISPSTKSSSIRCS